MVEVLDSRKNYQQVTRQSSLENLRQAEKNTPGRLREVFGTEVSLKNGEVKMDELKANKELKEGSRILFNLDKKENRDAYYNIRLKELMPEYVAQIRVRQLGNRGRSGVATLRNGEYYFPGGHRAEVFKTEVTVLSVEKGRKSSVELTKDNLETIARSEQGRARLRAYAMAANGRVILSRQDPLYNHFKIHYLFRGPAVKELYINNKKAVWANGKEGRTYYWETDKEKTRRAYFYTGNIIQLELPVSRVNLGKIAETPEGRARLRILALDSNGRVIVNASNPLYNSFRMHHLFRNEPVWVNGRKAVYTEGAAGRTYYYESDRNKTSRVMFFTGDTITTRPPGRQEVSRASRHQTRAETATARTPQQTPETAETAETAETPETQRVTARNIARIAATERGRELLRKIALDENGKVILTASPLYNAYRIHYLYRDIPIWVNGRKAIYRNGGEGMSYYYENDTQRRRRVYFFTGDIITTEPRDTDYLAKNLRLNHENIGRISRTEEGRARIREYCIGPDGKYKLNSANPIYGYIELHHLFREPAVWKNQHRCVLRNGVYYYAHNPSAKVSFRTNDYLSTKEMKNELGFTHNEEERLAAYTRFAPMYQKQHESAKFRTLQHRLEDHEILLNDLFNNKEDRDINKIRSVLFPTERHKPFFIDIGPGLADVDNADKYDVGGQGTPAVTSAEMAAKFPNMPVVALDLPDAVDVFMGKREARDRNNQPYQINDEQRDKLLKNQNVHVVSGDGLRSLKNQWENSETNPLPERRRPRITKDTTLFIRAANSIDILCSWYSRNGRSPSLRNALTRMAEEFKDNPVMLFFSKEIMIKPAGSVQWTIIGNTSDMGFNHRYYSSLDRKGKPPYEFNSDRLNNL